MHQRDVVFLQGDLIETLIGENGFTGVVEQRGAGKVHENPVVGENEKTLRPAIQGTFLEGLEHVPKGRVGEVADLLQSGSLGGGRGEGLSIIGGRVRGDRRIGPQAARTAHEQQEGEDA